jgi:hypothetical protein
VPGQLQGRAQHARVPGVPGQEYLLKAP